MGMEHYCEQEFKNVKIITSVLCQGSLVARLLIASVGGTTRSVAGSIRKCPKNR